MNRPWKIWLSFAFCSAVMLGVMAWVSATVLRLDRVQFQAQAQAEIEEKVRLALWRMDSMLAPLVAQETARPYFAYVPFHPAERAYGRMYNALGPGDVLVPSPLLTQVSTNILLHFQLDPQGALTSPQVPAGNQRDLAEAQFTTHERVESAAARLGELDQLLGKPATAELIRLAALPSLSKAKVSGGPLSNKDALIALTTAPWTAQSTALAQNRGVSPRPDVGQRPQSGLPALVQQQARNDQELEARAQSVQQAVDLNFNNTVANFGALSRPPVEELLKPVWLDDSLVLVRRVAVQGRDYIQGCWIDWPATRRWLLEGVSDLLPRAGLEPLKDRVADPEGRMLATLPVRVLPGSAPPDHRSIASPTRVAVALGWACVLFAGVAVALLLQGTLSLSERRAAFVSAVTHELRTPLTTFKMYSEMLATGMVPDQSKQREYLSRLCTEADRLQHLVENVLAYARLERGRASARIERLFARDLLARVNPRLVQRAEQSGMRIEQNLGSAGAETGVAVDVGAVEQILFNLVDNACKYAGPPEPTRVLHLQVLVRDGCALLRVRDEGPGISTETARRLFQPFSKSADEAASTAPGVGLGLALCRRLARSFGGDLRFNPSVRPGACFDVLLPLAGPEPHPKVAGAV